ncbi:hypothetical protein GTQ99_21640 [Kineococcus sp. T13]|uniref:hypothetical protein n=1 Tax=Kineococcus vitellinus TaxID=2696565 RepID=UPI001412643E|nr:hypothetical protein [Kineococcus vitellinus]NAZ77990.1 hypothetical protein [Kineococcus vitellinus]
MTDRHPDLADDAKASLLAAGIGGSLLVVTVPVFFSAVMWPVLDPGAVPAAVLVAMAAVATCTPVAVTAVIAARQRAAVRVSVLLVAVPQAVLCAPLLLLSVLGQR